MQALKVTDSDATCVGAWQSRGYNPLTAYDDEWAAVPDAYSHAVKVVDVETKGRNFVGLTFPDGSYVRIKSFVDGSPEDAILCAKEDLEYDKAEESDLSWWESDY